MADITAKQRMFADEYIKCGHVTEAYQRVYKCKRDTAEASGARLLGNVSVKKYISDKNKKLEKSTIADMTEIKEFWTSTVRETENERRDRLKASELIAKTNGAFIEKVEAHTVNENHNYNESHLQQMMDIATPEELDVLVKADEVCKRLQGRIKGSA